MSRELKPNGEARIESRKTWGADKGKVVRKSVEKVRITPKLIVASVGNFPERFDRVSGRDLSRQDHGASYARRVVAYRIGDGEWVVAGEAQQP